jgi:outer membrane immunogenic protein
MPVEFIRISFEASHMNRLLAAASALAVLAIASQASAADLSAAAAAPAYSKAPVIPPVVSSWTGFYVGADIGGIFGNGGSSNFSSNAAVVDNLAPALAGPLTTNDTRGLPASSAVIGGFHAGYNYQFAPSFLVGIEGDWQASSKRSTCRGTDNVNAGCTTNGDGAFTIDTSARSITTLRGRFGWVNDNIMVYGTGGAAWVDAQTTVGLNCDIGCGLNSLTQFAGSATTSAFKTGWVAGAGIEWMPAHNWIVRAEYLHVDAGSLTATLDGSAICNCTASATQNLRYDIVRAGFSYKFW